jgi:hypothetical protein
MEDRRLIDTRKWKEWQSAPDHTNMLEMWKEAGIEPIDLAKYGSSTFYIEAS